MSTAVSTRERGYTLLELMTVTAVLGLCLGVGTGLAALVERQRHWAAVAELQRLIMYTRNEAVSRQQRLTLCALDSERACQGEWTGREIAVFSDRDRNRRLDDGEAMLMSFWPASRGSLAWRASLRRSYLEYSKLGSTHQNGSFILCHSRGNGSTSGRRADLVLSINRGGRPYVRDPRRYRCR